MAVADAKRENDITSPFSHLYCFGTPSPIRLKLTAQHQRLAIPAFLLAPALPFTGHNEIPTSAFRPLPGADPSLGRPSVTPPGRCPAPTRRGALWGRAGTARRLVGAAWHGAGWRGRGEERRGGEERKRGSAGPRAAAELGRGGAPCVCPSAANGRGREAPPLLQRPPASLNGHLFPQTAARFLALSPPTSPIGADDCQFFPALSRYWLVGVGRDSGRCLRAAAPPPGRAPGSAGEQEAVAAVPAGGAGSVRTPLSRRQERSAALPHLAGAWLR